MKQKAIPGIAVVLTSFAAFWAVRADQIDRGRAQQQLDDAQAELEKVESGESQADRWVLEQRIIHAQTQLDYRRTVVDSTPAEMLMN